MHVNVRLLAHGQQCSPEIAPGGVCGWTRTDEPDAVWEECLVRIDMETLFIMLSNREFLLTSRRPRRCCRRACSESSHASLQLCQRVVARC